MVLLGRVVDLVALVVAPVLIGLLVLALLTSGAMLLHPEGRKPANLLGLVAGLGLAAVTTVLVLVTRAGDPAGPWHVARIASLLLLDYGAAVFVGHLVSGLLYSRSVRPRPVDYVIVLGAGLIESRVTRLLASRLMRGLELLESPSWNPDGRAVIIVSGGQGPDESVTEASAMAAYLTQHGLAANRVLLEDRSTTTVENLELSSAIIARRGAGSRVAVVTNDFHVHRTASIARRLGLDATVVGSPTRAYYRPRAVLREYAALLAGRPWGHTLAGVGLVLVAVVGHLPS